MFGRFLIGAAAAALSSTALLAAPTGPAPANDTMWFTDAYATAYYALDQRRHEAVVHVDAGPQGGNPFIVQRELQDGATERLTIIGAGRNHLRATIIMSRRAGRFSAEVKSHVLPNRQASD